MLMLMLTLTLTRGKTDLSHGVSLTNRINNRARYSKALAAVFAVSRAFSVQGTAEKLSTGTILTG
jgi:hypothetical protein